MFDAQDFAARLAAREDRWSLLEGYPEGKLERAEDSLGLKLPASLKELYCCAGRRLSKMNNPLIEPEDLAVAQDILPFRAENQYVWTWGVRLGDLLLDDPPVFIDFNGCDAFSSSLMTPNRLLLQNQTLSEFAFQMVVGDYMQWGGGCEDVRGEKEVAGLLQAYQPLGFPD